MTFMNFLVTVSRPYDFFPLYFSFLAPSIHTTGSSFWRLLLFRHSFQPFMISSPYTFPFYSQEFTHMLDFLPLLFFFFTIPLQIHTTGFSFTGGKLELELTFPSPETPSSE